jgi:glycerate dehydrogenase
MTNQGVEDATTQFVFLDRSTIGPAVNLTKPTFAHDWIDHDRTRPDQVVERLAGADIAVCNKVPEHTFALILALRRELIGFRQDVINGNWQEADQFCFFTRPVKDLAGSTLGIIGEDALG